MEDKMEEDMARYMKGYMLKACEKALLRGVSDTHLTTDLHLQHLHHC
jgi:hypothetical protein